MSQDKFLPILLGSDMNVYGMARAFHEAYGIQSVAYAGTELAPTRFSKIVKVNQVDGFDHDPGFFDTLVDLAKTTYHDPEVRYLLIPCGDGYAELLAKHKEALKPYYTFIANDYALLERLINKVSFYEVCEEFSLPYPKTFILTKDLLTDGQFKEALPFDFPVALKPANSVAWLSVDFEGRKKAFIIDNRQEFDTIVSRIYQAGYEDEMIVQDFIPGDDSNMRVLNAYVDENNDVRVMALGHPLLEDPTPGAVGNYVVIIPDENQQIYQMIRKFLKEINYVGFANFDLKYDRRDGQYKLFEINLRQGRSSFFITLSGLNLAQFLTEDLVFEKPYTETIYGKADTPDAKLWLGVPKNIFLTYAKENQDKERAKKLLAQDRWGTTVFYKKDMSLKRWILLKRMFYLYNKRFKTFFSTKEG